MCAGNFSAVLRYIVMRIFILLFVTGTLNAQNLVVNPGFEEGAKQSCVIRTAGLPGWSMPSDGTSDLIVVSKKEKQKLQGKPPGYGLTAPFEGYACAGFLTVEGGHEYVCGTLSQPLVADCTYTISFALARILDSDFALNRIGMFFTTESKPYHTEAGMPSLPWTPQLTLDDADDATPYDHWTVYTLSYIATGGERSFVIGDFTDSFKRNSTEASYFFIDDVSVTASPVVTTPAAETVVSADTSSQQIETASADSNAIAPGKTLVLENIYFETGKSRILPESYPPLYNIIIELKLQPHLKVEIVGHTDKHGDPESNQKLSEERARAVADFFIARGIEASRISIRGEGQNKPVGNDDQKNRRVEFIFTE